MNLQEELTKGAEALLQEAEASYIADGGDPRVLIMMRAIREERRILSPARLVRSLIQVEPMPAGANIFYLSDDRPEE